MEVFSLEYEDYNVLFITQESKDNNDIEGTKTVSENDSGFGIDPFDFTSPCKSFIDGKEAYAAGCSNVSEEEFDGKFMMVDKNGR